MIKKYNALNETEIRTELQIILDNAISKIVYENSEIYFVDERQIEIIKLLQISASKIPTFTKKYNDPFFQFAKVLNKDYAAIAYKTFMKHKYKNVKDPEKVKDRIKKDFEITSYEIRKFYRNLLLEKANEIDENLRMKLNEEEAEKLEKVLEKKEFLLNNFEKLDIRITTFRDNDIYPHIKFIDVIEEEAVDYLRTEVPNILYAHKNIFIIQPGYRKDANHIRFVLNAEHAFGEIFYKEKEELDV